MSNRLEKGKGKGPAQRIVIAVTIVGLHLLPAVWMLTPRPLVAPRLIATPLIVRAVPAAAPIDRDGVPPLEVDLGAPDIDVASAAPAYAAECAVEDRLDAALAGNPDAGSILAGIAAGSSPAVMMWDGRWTSDAIGAGLRPILVAALRTVSADCLDQALTGPRLITIRVAGSAVTVALGSGAWRWRELLSKD